MLSISSLYQWLNKRLKTVNQNALLHLETSRSLCVHSTLTLPIEPCGYAAASDGEKQPFCRYNNNNSAAQIEWEEKKLSSNCDVRLWWSAIPFIEPYWVVFVALCSSWNGKNVTMYLFELKKNRRIIMWSSIVHHTLIWMAQMVGCWGKKNCNTRAEWKRTNVKEKENLNIRNKNKEKNCSQLHRGHERNRALDFFFPSLFLILFSWLACMIAAYPLLTATRCNLSYI